MPDEPDEPVPLLSVHDEADLIAVRAALEAAGVSFVLQGEHHASLMPGFAGSFVIERKVLVARSDLDRARAALAATPQPTTEGSPLSDAVCPVHERQALSTCSRCGTFLCADCHALGDRAVCEECAGKEAEALRPVRDRLAARRRTFVFVWLLAPLLLALAAALLGRTLGCDEPGPPRLPQRPRW